MLVKIKLVKTRKAPWGQTGNRFLGRQSKFNRNSATHSRALSS